MSEAQFRQRLAAILAADAAGYSSLMAADERTTVTALDAAREIFRTQIECNQGRVIDMAGDSILAVFEIATGALSAALAIQQKLDTDLRFRIGLHLGEIIEKPDGTVYGDGVNIAARLQALAEPGGIAVSDAVKGAVGRRVAAAFVDQGEQTVMALQRAEEAVALRPSCSNANPHLGNILYYCGRPADAADRIRQAMRLTPVHAPWFKVVLAASCKELRQWDDATAAAKEAVRMKADDVEARLVLIEICRATGNADAARDLVQEVSKLKPDFSVAKWAETQPYKDFAVLERITADLRSAGLAS